MLESVSGLRSLILSRPLILTFLERLRTISYTMTGLVRWYQDLEAVYRDPSESLAFSDRESKIRVLLRLSIMLSMHSTSEDFPEPSSSMLHILLARDLGRFQRRFVSSQVCSTEPCRLNRAEH